MFRSINKFTEEQIVGVDISDFSIEAALIYKKARGYALAAYSRFRLSPGIVENGHILQPDKLKEALNKLFTTAQPRQLKPDAVFLSVPESRVFAHLLTLPKSLKSKDITVAVQHKAEEVIPESMDNLISAFKTLDVKNGELEVFYMAAPKDLVNEFVQLFESISIGVAGITMESLSSFVGLADQFKQKRTLLLDIGARATIASIFDKNGIRDSINIPIAGHNITKALTQKLNISYTAAEEQKCQVGMDSSVGQGEIMLVIQGQMQPVADELKRFINFYEEANGVKLEQLILIGGTAQTKGLDKYFGDNLNLPVVLGQTFIDGRKLPINVKSTKYINALGLARLALIKKADINFYETARLGWQQRINLHNIKLWGGLFAKIFHKVPGFFKKVFGHWYSIVALIILLLGGAGYFYQDQLLSRFSLSIKTLSVELTTGISSSGEDNFIPSDLVTYQISVEGSFPELTYQEAIASLGVNADNLARVRTYEAVNNSQFIIPQIFSKEVSSISPAEEEYRATSSILVIGADYQFLSLNNQDVKELMLGNLSVKQAERFKDWRIANSRYEILNFYEERNSFRLMANLELHKP